VGSAEQLAELLSRQGLDGARLAAGYGAWRESIGFVGPAAWRALAPEGDGADAYAQLDSATLEGLAAAGDLGARQAQAERIATVDGFAGMEQFGEAVRQGSAAAVFQVARVLESLSGIRPDDTRDNPDLSAMISGLADGQPDGDPELQALAWSLAAVRRDGLGVLDAGLLARLEATAGELPPDRLAKVCARVPELQQQLEDFRPAAVRPPVFVTPSGAGRRIPCLGYGDLTPQSGCRSVPAQDAQGADIDVWICPDPSP
jgi:hypothetical protein